MINQYRIGIFLLDCKGWKINHECEWIILDWWGGGGHSSWILMIKSYILQDDSCRLLILRFFLLFLRGFVFWFCCGCCNKIILIETSTKIAINQFEIYYDGIFINIFNEISSCCHLIVFKSWKFKLKSKQMHLNLDIMKFFI